MLHEREIDALKSAGFETDLIDHLVRKAAHAGGLNRVRFMAHPAWGPALVFGATGLAALAWAFPANWLGAAVGTLILIGAGLLGAILMSSLGTGSTLDRTERHLIHTAIRAARSGGLAAEQELRRHASAAAGSGSATQAVRAIESGKRTQLLDRWLALPLTLITALMLLARRFF